ncbi:MAG TPA: hypothetical protein VF751_08850 [Chthoniobacterales bacterium]
MNSDPSDTETAAELLAGLRSAALVALVIGAIGSIGLLRHAQQHPPQLLIVLFVIWVCAPFGLLAAANFLSHRWPIRVRMTLYLVTLLVTLLSLGIYVDNNVAHRTAHPAGVWVAVPPASVLLAAIVVGIAAFKAKKTQRSS